MHATNLHMSIFLSCASTQCPTNFCAACVRSFFLPALAFADKLTDSLYFRYTLVKNAEQTKNKPEAEEQSQNAFWRKMHELSTNIGTGNVLSLLA